MNTFDFSRPVPLGAVSIYRVVTLVDTLLQALRNHLAVRRTAAMLHELDDAVLEDIGLTRGDIATAAQRCR